MFQVFFFPPMISDLLSFNAGNSFAQHKRKKNASSEKLHNSLLIEKRKLEYKVKWFSCVGGWFGSVRLLLLVTKKNTN